MAALLLIANNLAKLSCRITSVIVYVTNICFPLGINNQNNLFYSLSLTIYGYALDGGDPLQSLRFCIVSVAVTEIDRSKAHKQNCLFLLQKKESKSELGNDIALLYIP
jgi:hypothetical protein